MLGSVRSVSLRRVSRHAGTDVVKFVSFQAFARVGIFFSSGATLARKPCPLRLFISLTIDNHARPSKNS
jgi:hypothetical protein